MNKEKSNKREKTVNIENNSASYFPILTEITSSLYILRNQIKKAILLV